MKIGLIVAMQKELQLFADKLENCKKTNVNHLEFYCGKLENHQIYLIQSGIGKVCAAIACVEMIKNFNPDYIINLGVAGGIGKNIGVMDVVVAKNIAYHDVWCGTGNEKGQVQGLPAKFTSDEKLAKLFETVKSDVKIVYADIVSGDQFISDIDELKKIKANFPEAAAVDMESAAIAQVCFLYEKPFLSLRIISDTPGIENHNQQYLDFWNDAPKKSVEVICKLLALL